MPRIFDEPNMSDNALLVSVEDLINMAMGPSEKNIVNFKTIQTILYILARQQRLLEQRVEIRINELSPTPEKSKRQRAEPSTTESSSSKSPRARKRQMTAIKECPEKDQEKEKKQKEIELKTTPREKELRAEQKVKERELRAEKEKEKEMKAEQKEKDKAQKLEQKEKEKEMKAEQKEKDKAQKIEQKEKEKEMKAEQKEKDRTQKIEQKEKERVEKDAHKAERKEQDKIQKEKEKSDRLETRQQAKIDKEKEKTEKIASKEQAKLDKDEQRQKMKVEKEREKSPASAKKEKGKARLPAGSSIDITEVQRDKTKVLVVEKGPTTRTDSRTRSSIDVVTQSQFALLESAVRELMTKTGPVAPLKLPDNERLRSDIVKGSASLTDTMQALQVNARVQAAEAAIGRMTGLLTQLAAAGALPDDVIEKVDLVKQTLGPFEYDEGELVKSGLPTAHKSVVMDPLTRPSGQSRMSTRQSRASILPRPSATAAGTAAVPTHELEVVPGVTHEEMNEALDALKEELWKKLNNMTTRASAAADTAMHTAKAVSDKLDVALKLDVRISTLYSLVGDYSEQLSGFDAGLTTQMQGFQEQMSQIRADLKSGLAQLDNANNNTETAAVMELTERYEELVSELERTAHAHSALTAFQAQLGTELRGLVECVEMIREQKADRDEVVDGLRDKADSSRLAGLLPEAECAAARADLTRRLQLCHDKFRKQDNVWMGAIKDLSNIVDSKAEVIDLLSTRDAVEKQLRELRDKLQILAQVLGEPKAALTTRKLSQGARCGACGAEALVAAGRAVGAPPALPALRPPPPDAVPEPCLRDLMPPEPPDHRHACHRWVGGSHTLVTASTTRERAPIPFQTAPTRQYTGYGDDGRLYKMEEELQPCVECNKMEVPEGVVEDGAGDQGRKPTIVQDGLIEEQL